VTYSPGEAGKWGKWQVLSPWRRAPNRAARDGKEIFYINPAGQVEGCIRDGESVFATRNHRHAVRHFKPGSDLLHRHFSDDVAKDGKRFLVEPIRQPEIVELVLTILLHAGRFVTPGNSSWRNKMIARPPRLTTPSRPVETPPGQNSNKTMPNRTRDTSPDRALGMVDLPPDEETPHTRVDYLRRITTNPEKSRRRSTERNVIPGARHGRATGDLRST